MMKPCTLRASFSFVCPFATRRTTCHLQRGQYDPIHVCVWSGKRVGSASVRTPPGGPRIASGQSLPLLVERVTGALLLCRSIRFYILRYYDNCDVCAQRGPSSRSSLDSSPPQPLPEPTARSPPRSDMAIFNIDALFLTPWTSGVQRYRWAQRTQNTDKLLVLMDTPALSHTFLPRSGPPIPVPVPFPHLALGGRGVHEKRQRKINNIKIWFGPDGWTSSSSSSSSSRPTPCRGLLFVVLFFVFVDGKRG
jgi:hypothetical protein